MDKINSLIKDLDSIIKALNNIEKADIDDLESVRKDITFIGKKLDILNEEYKEDSTETDPSEA